MWRFAVGAAGRALTRNRGSDWASALGAVRAKYLRAIAAKITERKSELAKLEAINCGKPLDEAAWDMDDVAGCFEYYADLAECWDAKQNASVSLPMESFKSYVLKEPIGVIALITPWNYPLLMATWKVAPALAADILTGLGHEAGAPLASHPLVDRIAFTGSSATGSKIMAAAAQLVKKLVAMVHSFLGDFYVNKLDYVCNVADNRPYYFYFKQLLNGQFLDAFGRMVKFVVLHLDLSCM
ncbi:hypothetical protein EUGRSUZ_L01365 [Eucalyptus grandis]|uniref:aminobutyraldehyde dehydrogenase n=1 Tax=Eucalyptus grandis TaxID=71139 RepID=A0A058ZTD2_EUCGR|nr:hypothetical protein EUGRSUZ_L01365 [Eucalyptus grandis]